MAGPSVLPALGSAGCPRGTAGSESVSSGSAGAPRSTSPRSTRIPTPTSWRWSAATSIASTPRWRRTGSRPPGPRVDALRGPARGRRRPHHRHRHAERSARGAGRRRRPRRQAHPAREADRADRRRADRDPRRGARRRRPHHRVLRAPLQPLAALHPLDARERPPRPHPLRAHATTCRASPTGTRAGSGAAPSRAAAATCSRPAATPSTRCAGRPASRSPKCRRTTCRSRRATSGRRRSTSTSASRAARSDT